MTVSWMAIRTATLALVVALAALAGGAQPAPAQPAPAEPTPAKVKELLDLLADPGVRDWLAKQQHARPAPAAPPATAQPSLGARMASVREHLATLAAAVPTVPDELARASNILGLEFEEHGLFRVLLLIVGFVALGFGAEWLYYWAGARVERWIVALPLDSVEHRLRAVAVRLAYGTGIVAAFAVGSVGAFLALDWPPLLGEIVLSYLVAFLAVRLALVAGRFILAPGGERFRILPMTTPAAAFWHRRFALFVGWLAFGWVTVALAGTLGVSLDVRRIVAYVLGLGLLAIGLEAVWRRPRPAPQPVQDGERAPARGWFGGVAGTVLLSIYFVLLWLFWVASAMPLFWLAVVAVALPATMAATQRAVNHILRPPGAADADAASPGLIAISLGRGLRAALIVGAVVLLAHAWHVNLADMTAGDALTTRLVRGTLNVVVVALVTDFVWHILKALIDRKLGAAQAGGSPDSEEARRQARLRTLLPILRNVLFIVLLVMAVLTALASVGIEIGPLIAGAGVVGVAVGFGAQTLVRDIFSGMFYLLDDAFRVGEYIQSGNYKGVVESFSLRSIKLRHHRGPLYTVPFGVLGAIQNMSRDWVIDKMGVGVTYDTDVDKVKKLIKQIGKELSEIPEFAPHILEPLKMQGVEQFGDYAIRIRMKIKTKPGQQFTIRRRAYAMIKKAFEANGIKFASPTVTVAGGGGDAAAVARQGLELVQPPPAAS
ncbi:mechanosensitive ion channel family protein [Vineibacter terrae]|uniref:Mechanosensitive ion channel family protein n=1 Tax=Vineibacter terrae TaxID=2586908 RepID=A0A5C8P817_9HYPH|nr:mechanosensitive ion channel family protein [Vineibacter terrae]TXL69138.1 mechanosensitive ion channel family protein [Vineibacter terrae]